MSSGAAISSMRADTALAKAVVVVRGPFFLRFMHRHDGWAQAGKSWAYLLKHPLKYCRVSFSVSIYVCHRQHSPRDSTSHFGSY